MQPRPGDAIGIAQRGQHAAATALPSGRSTPTAVSLANERTSAVGGMRASSASHTAGSFSSARRHRFPWQVVRADQRRRRRTAFVARASGPPRPARTAGQRLRFRAAADPIQQCGPCRVGHRRMRQPQQIAMRPAVRAGGTLPTGRPASPAGWAAYHAPIGSAQASGPSPAHLRRRWRIETGACRSGPRAAAPPSAARRVPRSSAEAARASANSAGSLLRRTAPLADGDDACHGACRRRP